MKYIWNIFIFINFNIFKIYLKCTWNIFEIYLKYIWNTMKFMKIWIYLKYIYIHKLQYIWNTSPPSASSSAPCIASAALFRPLQIEIYFYNQYIALKIDIEMIFFRTWKINGNFLQSTKPCRPCLATEDVDWHISVNLYQYTNFVSTQRFNSVLFICQMNQ